MALSLEWESCKISDAYQPTTPPYQTVHANGNLADSSALLNSEMQRQSNDLRH
jgi:hypothetical protein